MKSASTSAEPRCEPIGQGRAIDLLRRAVRSGKLHHAWIFHGPFGVGKCMTAMELARLLLDPEATDEDRARFRGPDSTRVADLISTAGHPDLHLIRKESSEDSAIASLRERKQTNIPVDLLRERMLGGEVDGRTFDGPVWRSPYLGHRKVFIIDEAELLDSVGQNALLKTLEEPPPGTFIILVTTREDRLLPTIRSRCQRVGFAPLSAPDLARWLDRTQRVPSERRAWLLRYAEGSPGMVDLALKHGVAEWADEIRPQLDLLSRGRFAAGIADRWAEIIGDAAEAIVKERPRASKEAANRLATRLLFNVLGERIREELRAAAEDDDAEEIERWSSVADALAGADEEVRRHLNLKQVLANLAAQWSLRAASGAST